MSDTTNRDIGRKRVYQKEHKRDCGCWHCLSGKEKLREIKQKVDKKIFDEQAHGIGVKDEV